MALTNADWREIESFVARVLSRSGEAFVQGKVVRTDTARRVVFLKEFGDTPIPLIGFDYQVKYSYTEPSGSTTVRKTKAYSNEVEMLVPKVGDIVLIAQHYGTRRLPKCLGVIKSKRYVVSTGE